jgi:DNA-directed RNA polymerase subunit K/omega
MSKANSASKRVNKTKTAKPQPLAEVDIMREKTIESISDFGRSADFTNATFKQLSSALKMHVFMPAEIHTEVERKYYIIPANKRRTSEVMSEFEYARVKCERAQQIQNGAPIFVDADPHMNEVEIATLEIKLRCCPLSILRMINERVGEIWTVNEMEIPFN